MSCGACGAEEEPRVLYRVRGFRVGRCARCGHGQVLDPPEDPSRIYDAGYFEGHEDGYAAYGASEPVLRREFARTVERLRAFVPGGALVEIGCAYGVFLDLAREHFRVLGVEVSEDAAGRARSRGHEVVASVDRLEGPFDACVMLDVIEHLARPYEVLRALRPRLRGALLLTTGDFSSLLARAMGKRWRLMTPPQHLHFFTRRSLEIVLERAGFRVGAVERPRKLVPVALAAHQLARITASSLVRRAAARVPSDLGAPINLFDTVRVIAW